MSTRVQIVMEELERDAFRRAAAREGISLSDWLRRAARERLQASDRISTLDELRAFFTRCRQHEEGTEPDWEHHRAAIEESIATGRTRT